MENKTFVHQHKSLVFAGLFLLILAVGCSKTAMQAQFAPDQAAPDLPDDQFSKSSRPYCEMDYADYEVRSHVFNYQLHKGTDISFGFNLVQNFLKMFDISVKVTSGRMDLSMDLSTPLNPNQSVYSTLGAGTLNSTELKFNFEISKFNLGLDYWYETPLSKMTSKGLTDVIQKVQAQRKKMDTIWKTVVIDVYQANEGAPQVTIPVGMTALVRKGDQFAIYNVDHRWKGEPCASEYIAAYKNPLTPIAIGTVDVVNEDSSILTLSNFNPDVIVTEGARVEVYKLAAAKNEKRAALLKSVRIKSVTSGTFSVAGYGKVNFADFTKEQMRSVLRDNGFVVVGQNDPRPLYLP